jgi:CoA-binding domain
MTVSSSASGVKHRMPVDATSFGESAASTAIGRLERLLVQIVALEFLLITATCYLASAIYYETFLSTWPPLEQYGPAALSIALLVLFTALGFKHYVGVQAQSRDQFMWSGIGAVALAFSLFLSLLFVFKIADWYSRGTFFFQFIGAATAMLITRGTIHAHIRRAIASGAVEARRAVVIGDPNDNRDILNNLRQSGIRSVGNLPLPHIHGNTVPGVGAFSHNIRKFVDRCRAFKPDDIIFLGRAMRLASDRVRSGCFVGASRHGPYHSDRCDRPLGVVQGRQLRRNRHRSGASPATVCVRSVREASIRHMHRGAGSAGVLATFARGFAGSQA